MKLPDAKEPAKPENAGEPRPVQSALKSATLVIAVILLLVAVSFLGLGAGYFNALFNKH
jgi:hypothetical protein